MALPRKPIAGGSRWWGEGGHAPEEIHFSGRRLARMTVSVDIATGRLLLRLDPSAEPSGWSLDRLCGFAARNNPRRGFLFVSKLLGKHWPARPSAMRQTHEALAAKVTASASDEVIFIGMCETATGLGHGVFDAWRERHEAGMYLQTTRYTLEGAETFRFEEAHSHASDIRLHAPDRAALRDRLRRTTLAVLIDDEISTGRTLAALIAALRPSCPLLRRVQLLCLTDFSAGQARAAVAAVPGIESCEAASLLSGEFEFERNPAFSAPPVESAMGSAPCRRGHISGYSARLGLERTPGFPPALAEKLARESGRTCLVVGTGEFMHGAFVVARALEQRGVEAFVQSTTRSPILVGQDIACATRVPDPYGEGIPNFLYNYRRADYTGVWVVHETPRDALVTALCRTLDARPVLLRPGEETLA
ncbi:MAG: phosphoribosyltransferase domain-containing protein [Panacagrimonas sp.]